MSGGRDPGGDADAAEELYICCIVLNPEEDLVGDKYICIVLNPEEGLVGDEYIIRVFQIMS